MVKYILSIKHFVFIVYIPVNTDASIATSYEMCLKEQFVYGYHWDQELLMPLMSEMLSWAAETKNEIPYNKFCLNA